MTAVLVHGFPETSAVWNPLVEALDREAVSLVLPGLGAPRPDGFAGTLDVAQRLGAEPVRLDNLGHCWMAESPATVAAALERFWSSLP